MGRRNQSLEEEVRRAQIRELLQLSNVSSMEDIQTLFKDTIAEFMESGPETERDDLGYSRNGYSDKTLRARGFRNEVFQALEKVVD